jgi:hypothetical protein
MSEWIGGNWVWLLLGVGLVWFLLRRGGMGCGMGGHGGHAHHPEDAGRQLPASTAGAGKDPQGRGVKSPEPGTSKGEGSHRHAGCC